MKTKSSALPGAPSAQSAPRAAILALLALGLPALSLAQASSPWLPIPGSGSVGLNYVTQRADSAYIGSTNLPISAITGGGAQRFNRDSYGLNLSYGVTDSVALDAAIGRGSVKVGAADSSSGQTDTILGVNWRVLDEYESRGLPTVTLRAAGIISGGTDGARLGALSKAADGYGVSVLVGKQIGTAFRVWGGLGVENRNKGVPRATSFDLNGAYSITPQLALSAGYTNKKFGGNLDIGGPGFSPALFQNVREERETGRLGLSYAIAGNQSVALNFSKVLSGRNAVKDNQIVGVGYSYGF